MYDDMKIDMMFINEELKGNYKEYINKEFKNLKLQELHTIFNDDVITKISYDIAKFINRDKEWKNKYVIFLYKELKEYRDNHTMFEMRYAPDGWFYHAKDKDFEIPDLRYDAVTDLFIKFADSSGLYELWKNDLLNGNKFPTPKGYRPTTGYR